MAIREILRLGNPKLRQKARALDPVELKSEQMKKLLGDMYDTMHSSKGIGLAAPQIGELLQIALIEIGENNPRYPQARKSESYVLVNPKITILDDQTQEFWEGCLSIPGLRGRVSRPRKIKVNFLDDQGNPSELIVEDFLATVFQHEIDHLNGVLYVDKLVSSLDFGFSEELDEQLK